MRIIDRISGLFGRAVVPQIGVTVPILGAGMVASNDELDAIKSCLPGATFTPTLSAFSPGTAFPRILTGLGVGSEVLSNSAVLACVSALSMGFCEAELAVVGRAGRANRTHSLAAVFEQPGADVSQKDLMAMMATYAYLGGGAFVEMMLDRYSRGWQLVGLDVHSVHHVERDLRTGKIYRVYRQNSGQWETVDHSDFIGLRWPVANPSDRLLGTSPTLGMQSELVADQSAVDMVRDTIENDGIPFAALKLPAGVKLDDTAKANMRKEYAQRRSNKKDLAFLEGGADWARPNMSLSELDLENVYMMSESRLSAVSRVPAIVAGLQAGLKSATYSNFENARSMFTESTLMSLWSSWGKALTNGMRREQVLTTEEAVGFDTTGVAGLSELRRKTANSVRQDYLAGLLTYDEAREALGYSAVGGERGGQTYLEARARSSGGSISMGIGGDVGYGSEGGTSVGLEDIDTGMATGTETLEELQEAYAPTLEIDRVPDLLKVSPAEVGRRNGYVSRNGGITAARPLGY